MSVMPSNYEVMTTWDKIADAYQKEVKISTDEIHYGPLIPGENTFRLIDSTKNVIAAEIGCGGAQDSIVLAKKGCNVVAIDISKQQLRHARKLAEINDVTVKLIQMDAESIGCLKDNFFDFAISVFTLDYVSNIERAIQGLRAVLKPHGYAIIAVQHPFYNVFNPIREGKNEIKGYFERGILKWTWKFDTGLDVLMFRFHRTLEDWFDSFKESGFHIERILEPKLYSEEELADPAIARKVPYSYNRRSLEGTEILRSRLPHTIIFKIRKAKTD